MRLAVSNLAWRQDEDDAARAHLKLLGVRGVEIAPTKVWPDPLSIPHAEIIAYRKRWNDDGIEIVAMQSLLYNRPDLQLFGTTAQRYDLFDYLCDMMKVGWLLGAKVAVFGSPKNRRVPAGVEIDLPLLYDFFTGLSSVARENGIVFCLEPNPSSYGCNFITTHDEAEMFSRIIAHDHFKINFDTGIAFIGNELADEEVGHVHLSNPFLGVVNKLESKHRSAAESLRKMGYAGWLSIEQASSMYGDNLVDVSSAVAFCERIYEAPAS